MCSKTFRSYEEEQEYLQSLLLESEDRPTFYDDSDGEEIDCLEERSDSESEQEVSNSSESDAEQSVDRDTPFYLGKDKKTKWTKMCGSSKVRTRAQNIIRDLPGVRNVARDVKTPVDCFFLFF